MKSAVSSFVLFTLMLSGRVRAEEPVLYTAKITNQQNTHNGTLFFSLAPKKWLVVDPIAMQSWIMEPKAVSEPQDIIKGKPASGVTFLAKGFNPKDSSVVVVWSQPASPGTGDRQVQHFMSRYKDGTWSDRELIPGQAPFLLGSSTLISDEAGRILVLWRQDAPETTAPPLGKPSAQRTRPTKGGSEKPKAWFYSVIAEAGPSPATLVPGQSSVPWLPSPYSFFDQKNHRFVIVFEGSQAQTTLQKRQLAYGFWQDGSLQAFQPLTKEGDNGSESPEWMTIDDGSLRLLWAYRKTGTNPMAKAKNPFVLRYAELEAGKTTFGPVHTLSQVHYVPHGGRFIRTSEGGFFTAWVERPNPAKPATQLHSLFFAKNGSVSMGQVSFLSKKAERDDAGYEVRYQPTLDGKVAIALGATNQSNAQHALVYTSYWEQGELASVQLLPGQGEALQNIQLEVDSTGTPILAWTQLELNADEKVSHEVFVSFWGKKGFSPAEQIVRFANAHAVNFYLFTKARTTPQVVFGSSLHGSRPDIIVLHAISMQADRQWSLAESLGNRFGDAHAIWAQSSILYINNKEEQLFLLHGPKGFSSMVCKQGRCAAVQEWKHPNFVNESQFDTFSSEADGSLLVRWVESVTPPPPPPLPTPSRRKRKNLPEPVSTEPASTEPIFYTRIIHFPDFKRSDKR